MTIASAFNEIAVANGGQADNSGTIAGAIDACADALAGSDVAQGATIEDGVRVLGEYISGGGGGGTYSVTQSADVQNGEIKTYKGVYSSDDDTYIQTGDPITSAAGGEILVMVATPNAGYSLISSSFDPIEMTHGMALGSIHGDGTAYFVMPNANVETYAEFDQG